MRIGRFTKAMISIALLSTACQRTSRTTVPADAGVALTLAVPLSPENAALLTGIQDDVVADIYLEDELVAEGIRGGIRGGVRGGIRGAETGGVRGGMRGIPLRQDELVTDVAFEITFSLPRRKAQDGLNSLRTRLRPSSTPEVTLVEVTTSVNILFSDNTRTVQIEEKGVGLNETVLPDLDGDGISSLTEVVVSGLNAALDQTTKPTEKEVKAALTTLADKLNQELLASGGTAVVLPPTLTVFPPPGLPERHGAGAFVIAAGRGVSGDFRTAGSLEGNPTGQGAEEKFILKGESPK